MNTVTAAKNRDTEMLGDEYAKPSRLTERSKVGRQDRRRSHDDNLDYEDDSKALTRLQQKRVKR